jgi:OOP family OmpA-OmpF porin
MFAFAVFLFAPAAQAEIVAGASIGQANIEYNLDDDFTFDEGDMGWKIRGGFRFIKFFGLEAEYVNLGKPEDTIKDVPTGPATTTDVDLETELTAFDIFAVGVLPLGSRFELFGKVGYVIWDAEIAAKNVAGIDEDEDGSDFAYGAGVAIKFASIFALRAEYEIYDAEDTEDVSFASIGLDFRF